MRFKKINGEYIIPHMKNSTKYERRCGPKRMIYIKNMNIKKLLTVDPHPERSFRHKANVDYEKYHRDGFFGSIEFYDELKKSIAKNGIINPLEAEIVDKDVYLIVCGCSRLSVARELKFKTVPVVIFIFDDDEEKYAPDGISIEKHKDLEDYYYKSETVNYYQNYVIDRNIMDDWWIDQNIKKNIINSFEYNNKHILSCTVHHIS